MLVSGKKFSITKYVVSDDIDDIQDPRNHMRHRTFFRPVNDGPGWLYVLGIPPRADLSLWTPGARATDLGQGPNMRKGPERAACVPRSREHDERSAAREKEIPKGQQTHLYIYRVPLQDVWREIPEVTQVEEKGHEGSTAVVTAYNIHVGENIFKETARREFLLTTTIHFQH